MIDLLSVALCCLVWVTFLLVALLWLMTLKRSATRMPFRRFVLTTRTSVCLYLTVVVASVAMTDWPFRVAFAIARPRMEWLAGRVERGYVLKQPFHAGWFTVYKARIGKGGFTCLFTCPSGGECQGFIKCSARQVEDHFNVWSNTEVAPGWQYLIED